MADLSIDRLCEIVQHLDGGGIRLFGSTFRRDRNHRKDTQLWYSCQRLIEAYVSDQYLLRHGHRRHKRSWDALFPSTLGNRHRIHCVSDSLGDHKTIVIGEPCPSCDHGRLAAFVHPDDEAAGVCCNAACGFSKEMGRLPIGRADDEQIIWEDPNLPGSIPLILPYRELLSGAAASVPKPDEYRPHDSPPPSS